MGFESGAIGRAPEAQGSGGPDAGRRLTLVPPTADDRSIAGRPLPPLPPARPAGTDLPAPPEAPSWSPLLVALPLFAAIWVCFGVLAATVTGPPAAETVRLGNLLATAVAVVALVLLTLSVAHTQVSGRPPRPAVLGTLALGAGQALICLGIGSGLWGIAARVFGLVGVAVPLMWVGGQFQSGVRRQQVERHNSLIASFTDRVRRQAQGTVESVHRHDVRSMLFVIEGATRVLGDPNLPADQRASFSEMLDDSLGRLASLTDVHTEEIEPFDVADVVRAVTHAERKAGRTVTAAVPAGLRAVGRAADVAAVLRTLVGISGTAGPGGIHVQVTIRGELHHGAAVLVVEPTGEDPEPLLARNWDAIQAESFKITSRADEEEMNLFVAARLLADQGADLWFTAGRSRFAVRLATSPDASPEEQG
ncbi:MAG TPA: hypothetical protein VFE55_20885 [Acidimicrobiia bacterium]|nr:hypothetical protein [Acidimicrobiia bacterium]